MKRKEIKEIIRKYGYTMIKPSYFAGDDKECCIFNAFDEHGVVWEWYVNWKNKTAHIQMLSGCQLLEKSDCAFMFWDGGR